MKAATYPLLALAFAAVTVGCEPGVPTIEGEPDGLVLPDVEFAKAGGRLALPLDGEAASDADGEGLEEETYCEQWERTEETWSAITGEFRYVDECMDGLGDIARAVTEGSGDNEGNGSYTVTYELRDGGAIIWDYEYTTDPETGTTTTTGSSNEGETYVGEHTYDEATGDTLVHEEYEYTEGTYVLDGTYSAEGFFDGTSVFDDPATDASPDYVMTHAEDENGLVQSVDGVFDGWGYDYDYVVNADGSADYDFESDDPLTQVSPDYSGAYDYAADGSGAGEYLQLFDDGSKMVVTDVWDSESLTESWVFDDAATALAVDQEGSIAYGTDGSGSGSVTTHLEDGTQETCQLDVSADGATTVSECSAS